MTPEERFNLITRNTAEVVQEDELRDILEKKDSISAYIGFASTGRVHIGYFLPLMKIADFLKAGVKFKILLANLHAFLDDQKTPFELLDHRFIYYREIITAMLRSLGVDTSNLEFVKGSDVQLNPDYTLDVYRLASMNTFSRCKRAASEVVRFGDEPKLSGFIYPILQALDEQYLDVDIQLGGLDQRKIMMFARENLPRLGYRPRIEIMNPMLPGLTGAKMSSSEASSKIDCLEPSDILDKKVKGAFCEAGDVENNGVLAFVKAVLMPLSQDSGKPFIIERPEKFGGNLEYSDYSSLESDFADKKLHPLDLKNAVAREVNTILEPVRQHFVEKQDILEKAYPEG